MAKGKKYGQNMVRAIPEPVDGPLITGQWFAPGPNAWCNLAINGEGVASVPVEGVQVQALTALDTGLIRIVQVGKDPITQGYPVRQYVEESFHIDDLNKIIVFVPAAGDGVAYIAIGKAVD